MIEYIHEHIDEIVFLTIIGVIGIRADYLLGKIDEHIKVLVYTRVPRLATKAKLLNPCGVCRPIPHDLTSHYFRSKLTHNEAGCYECKVCDGFVMLVEGEPTINP